MNQQKLPNSTTVLVLGIISIVSLCCWGVISLVTGGIGFYLARKDEALYQANPSLYSDIQNLRTGKILSLVGLILGIISTLYMIYLLSTIGYDGFQQQIQEAIKNAQKQ